jgi:putative addiction module component, TIGR02574 family
MSTQFSDILQLSVADRIQLAEDIWESIAAFPEAVPLTENQRNELDHRLQTAAANPEAGIPWKELKENLLKSQ